MTWATHHQFPGACRQQEERRGGPAVHRAKPRLTNAAAIFGVFFLAAFGP